MRAKAGLIFLLGLFLIVGTVSAFVADSTSTIISGNLWPVANGADTSVITVTALNASGGPVGSATVSFSLAGYENYGTLSSDTESTNSAGIATTKFKTKTKSGTAVITATITSSDSMGSLSVPITLNQEIDHDKAVSASFNSPPELPAGSTHTLVVTVTDGHGNLVDNRGPIPAEQHTFDLYMTDAEGRGFWDGSGYTLKTTSPSLQTDALGTASVALRIANATGRNMIFMQKIGSMSHTFETWIDGVGIQDPAYMLQDDPNPETVYADGISYTSLSYHVYDPQMNPLNGTLVHIVTSDGESMDKYSVDGLVFFEYGQKTEAQTNTITVTSSNATMLCQPDGTTGYCSQDVLFVNTGPVDFYLTGMPGTLTSLDQATGTKEGIARAVVVDARGNPVENEVVTFSITPFTDPAYRDIPDGGPYNETTPPALSTTRIGSSLTNTTVGGSALAFFTPGAFALSGANYSASATGNATVTATWGGITKSVRFSWKNYPALSVKLPDDICKDKHVGDEIDLGMSVLGDGAALAPNPVDAILCMDSSGSMGDTMLPNPPNQNKLYWTKAAGLTFVNAMNEGTDSIGLAYYNYTADVQPELAKDFVGVKDALSNGLKPSGYTNTREGLKLSIDNVVLLSTNSKAVKAVILLTDGAYNRNGDPLARDKTRSHDHTLSGSDGCKDWYYFSGLSAAEQDLAYYASSHNVRIYTITLGGDAKIQPGYDNTTLAPGTWQIYDTMDLLATSTGGFHRHTTDGSQLADIYTEIAGDLQQEAGGDADITLDFSAAKDGTTGIDIKDYMEYIYRTPDSTHIKMVNATNEVLFDYVQDDRPNWTNGLIAPSLYIKAGDMSLGDLWTLNLKLNLTKSGNIKLFGPDDAASKVCFIDVKTKEKTCTQVEEFNCAIKEDTGGGFTNEAVTVDITSATNLAADPKTLTVNWLATYVGKGKVTQTLSYKNLDLPGGYIAADVKVDDISDFSAGGGSVSHTTTLDTSTWPPGRYAIRVIGNSGKASNSDQEFWIKQDESAPIFLKLE